MAERSASLGLEAPSFRANPIPEAVATPQLHEYAAKERERKVRLCLACLWLVHEYATKRRDRQDYLGLASWL